MLQDKGILPARPERLRLDTIDFQLKVYELVKKGETFDQNDAITKRPISTVKSALLAVSKKIASLVIPAISPPVVQKKSLPLVDIDPDTHMSQCSQCSSAKGLEDMCEVARRFVNQDYVSEHELTGGDKISDVADPNTLNDPNTSSSDDTCDT